MHNIWHCDICNYQRVDMQQGSLCTLTDRKPSFYKMCAKISLTDKFEGKLIEASIKVKKIEKERWLKYGFFIIFLILGFSALWFAFELTALIRGFELRSNSIWITILPFYIGGVSLLLFHQAIGTLNNYRQDLKAALRDKSQIDEVLAIYNERYEISINFGKNYLGVQEVEADLKRL